VFDIIAVGDATEDVFLQLKEAHFHMHDHVQELAIRFATKVPVERVDKLIGGNAANLAIGSSRLELKASLYSVLGLDEQGRKILKFLKKERVNTRYVRLLKGKETNYSVVLNHGAERTILIYHVPRNYYLPRFEKSKWLYVSSMGKGNEKLFPYFLDYIKKNDSKLGFNPGTHQLRLGKEKLKKMLEASEVVLLNKEEVQFLTKAKSNNIKTLLKEYYKLGMKIAVLTDGPNGSYVYDGEDFWFQDIYDVPIIERTGCGDSYSTGFIAALIHGYNFKEGMRWGTINAASVIQKIGPQEGLMKLAQLKDILKKHPGFKPRKF
jgi:sugar/nucleoside kinase (ribokinase family)